MAFFKRSSLFVIIASLAIATGCVPRPDPNVLQRAQPNITAFLSAYSFGRPMSPNVFSESVRVTRIGGEFDEVKTYTRESYASFWREQFQQWRPIDFSAVIVSEYAHVVPPADQGWYARYVVHISYERSDNGVEHAAIWTLTTDYFGRIAIIAIE